MPQSKSQRLNGQKGDKMQFKKIVLAMFAVVLMLSISLFAVSCARNNQGGNSDAQSVTDSSSDPQSSSAGEQFGYRVEYYQQKIDGEGYAVVSVSTKSALSGSTVTAEIPSYDGFTHVTTEDSKESGVLDSNNSLVLKVYYNRNKYTLSLSSDIETEISGAGEYYYKSTVSVSAEKIAGYIFKGWFDGDNADPVNENRQFSYTVEKDTSLKAKWEASNETQYVVKHYQQKVDGSGYDLYETVDHFGVTGDTAQATIKTNYTGFYHDENNVNALESGVIAGDNSLVLSVYYNRETYTVTLNGGNNAVEVKGAGQYRYGEDTEIDISTVGGFEFICWAEGNV